MPLPWRVRATCTVSFNIVGNNNNGGQSAFGTASVTARNGVIFVASHHDYRDGQRFYSIRLNLSDDGTAAYGPAVNRVTFVINATLIHIPVPPLFLSNPNGTTWIQGQWLRAAVPFIPTVRPVFNLAHWLVGGF